jgi:ssDNA-binding Zn-finger/Zn-ribbon topoisomerase 1
MNDDDKCDTCGSPLSILRNRKGSRYVACRNSKCKRGEKNQEAPVSKTTQKVIGAPKRDDTRAAGTVGGKMRKEASGAPIKKRAPFTLGW